MQAFLTIKDGGIVDEEGTYDINDVIRGELNERCRCFNAIVVNEF